MLSDRDIINEIRGVVTEDARTQIAIWECQRVATTKAAACEACLRDNYRNFEITDRVRDLIRDELAAIEAFATQFPAAVFFFLAKSAQKNRMDPGMASLIGIPSVSESKYYFTRRDWLGCKSNPRASVAELFQWTHNGEPITLEQANELVPAPAPDRHIEIYS